MNESPPSQPSTTEATLVAAGEAEPRSAQYWIRWSTCGEDSRADQAAANGGRANGFVLIDDLLEEPGLSIGEYRVATCDRAVDLLLVAEDPSSSDQVTLLAADVLLTELNLSVGSKGCDAVEGAVSAGHMLLASIGYDAGTSSPSELSVSEEESVRRIIEMLGRYKANDLCD